MSTFLYGFGLSLILVNAVFGGPGHHAHDNVKVVTEKYVITLPLYSGIKAEPQWSITHEDMKNKDIKTIADAIHQVGSRVMAKGNQELPAVLGYKGFEIEHFINGKPLHKWNLPKCMFPALEKILIKYTSGTALQAKTKKTVLPEIEKCPTKAATKATTKATTTKKP